MRSGFFIEDYMFFENVQQAAEVTAALILGNTQIQSSHITKLIKEIERYWTGNYIALMDFEVGPEYQAIIISGSFMEIVAEISQRGAVFAVFEVEENE